MRCRGVGQAVLKTWAIRIWTQLSDRDSRQMTRDPIIVLVGSSRTGRVVGEMNAPLGFMHIFEV